MYLYIYIKFTLNTQVTGYEYENFFGRRLFLEEKVLTLCICTIGTSITTPRKSKYLKTTVWILDVLTYERQPNQWNNLLNILPRIIVIIVRHAGRISPWKWVIGVHLRSKNSERFIDWMFLRKTITPITLFFFLCLFYCFNIIRVFALNQIQQKL